MKSQSRSWVRPLGARPRYPYPPSARALRAQLGCTFSSGRASPSSPSYSSRIPRVSICVPANSFPNSQRARIRVSFGQLPIFVILDALDECSSTTETPSAREKVLEFVEELVGSGHSNLFICITSRPEQDILVVRTVLDPLTSVSLRVSFHEESGQREDINNYLRSFVQIAIDRAMQRWKEEDKELIINTVT